MIAKRIARPKAGSGFRGLANYATDARKAAKVMLNRLTNLRQAPAMMRTTAANAPDDVDPVVHWTVSWPDGETPADEQALQAARTLMARLGYGDHQFIAAVHRDSGHTHVHIAVNAVHPRTREVHRPAGDFLIADRTMRELELKQGWRHDRGRLQIADDGVIRDAGPDPARGAAVSQRAVAMENATGAESLQRRLAGDVDLAERMRAAESWGDLHARVGERGLVAEPVQHAGRTGLVLRAPETQDGAVAASQIASDCTRPALEARLGAFQPAPGADRQTGAHRKRRKRTQDAGYEALVARHHRERNALKDAQQTERLTMLRDPRIPGPAKPALEQAFAEDRRREWADLKARHARERAALTASADPAKTTAAASGATPEDHISEPEPGDDGNLVPLLIEDGWTRATDGGDPDVWHRDGVALRLHYDAPGVARHYTNVADPWDTGGVDTYIATHRNHEPVARPGMG